MALTQDDLQKLSIVVSDAIDKKLDEKFNPIMIKFEELHVRLEEIYTKIGLILDRLDQLFEKFERLD